MITSTLWHKDNCQSFRLMEYQVPARSDQVNLQGICSLVSNGTERTVATGKVPESCYDPMTVPYMGGTFDFPIAYGYNWVGRDEKGITYQVMHPHQSAIVIAKNDAHRIPDGISPSRAALFGTVETVMTGIWDGEIEKDDPILVLGGGLIGLTLATALIHELNCTQVHLCEHLSSRQTVATKLQIPLIDTPLSHHYEVCFHTTGSESGLAMALQSVGLEGRVIELSWYGDQRISIPLGTDFHYMRKRIIASQVSHIPTKLKRKGWDYEKRRQTVWHWLQNPIFDSIITHRVPWSKVEAFYNESLRGRALEGVGYLIEYNS